MPPIYACVCVCVHLKSVYTVHVYSLRCACIQNRIKYIQYTYMNIQGTCTEYVHDVIVFTKILIKRVL